MSSLQHRVAKPHFLQHLGLLIAQLCTSGLLFSHTCAATQEGAAPPRPSHDYYKYKHWRQPEVCAGCGKSIVQQGDERALARFAMNTALYCYPVRWYLVEFAVREDRRFLPPTLAPSCRALRFTAPTDIYFPCLFADGCIWRLHR